VTAGGRRKRSAYRAGSRQPAPLTNWAGPFIIIAMLTGLAAYVLFFFGCYAASNAF